MPTNSEFFEKTESQVIVELNKERESESDETGRATELLLELLAGNEESMAELYDRYAEFFAGIARNRLKNSPVRFKDEYDAVQSTIFLFLQAVRKGKYQEVRNHKSFEYVAIRFLINRTKDYIKAETTLKRSGNHVVDVSSLNSEQHQEFPDPKTNESCFQRSVEDLIDELSDPLARKIFELKVQGFKQQEIAKQLGKSLRTIQRTMHLAKVRLQKSWED